MKKWLQKIFSKNNMDKCFYGFEYYSSGIIIVSRQGKIVKANKVIHEIFGYDNHELQNQSIDLLLPQSVKEKHPQYIANFSLKSIRSRVMGKTPFVNGMKKDGSYIHIQITLDVLTIHNQDYIIASISEIERGNNFLDNLNQYKMFFDVCNDMFCIASIEGLFIKVNNAFITTLGYTETELYTEPFINLVHPDDRTKTLDALKTIETNHILSDFTNRYLTKNGTYKVLQWRAYSIGDNNIYSVAIDITQDIIMQQQLEEKEMLATEAEQLANFGCWKWKINDPKIYWTNGLRKIYNIEPDQEVTFETYSNINFENDRPYIESTIQKCIENEESYEIKHGIIVNDELRYLYAKGKYITIDSENYIIGVAQDVTDTVRIEEELKDAKTAAEKASALKSVFLANMSHEIRTPINGVMGMTTLLQSTKLDNEQAEFLDIIVDSCGILLSLINNILDFSKIESGKEVVNLGVVDRREVVSFIHNIYEQMAVKKGLKFDLNITSNVPISFTNDIFKLKRILSNILSNAIKFTEEGHVNLTISSKTINDNEHLVFVISDSGIGISAKNIPKLFKPFNQGDSSTTKRFGGTGLGLAICKTLVELLQGNISLVSEVNVGTTVTFNIPYKKAIVPEKSTRVTIVVIEDNKSNQFVMKKFLEKLNHNDVVIFDNGRIALDNIKNFTPSIIFMDIHMPIINGYECAVGIRKIGMTCPIVAVTANAMEGVK